MNKTNNRELATQILERLCQKGLMDDLRSFVGRKHKNVLLGDFTNAMEELLNEKFPRGVSESTDADDQMQDWETFGENNI